MLCSLFLASSAYAHPPASINVKYDPATKQITAIIAHQVSNPQRHYIEKVKVQLNQQTPIIKRFVFQKTAREQEFVISIPNAVSGDVIVIEAYCNKGGRLAQEIRVQ